MVSIAPSPRNGLLKHPCWNFSRRFAFTTSLQTLQDQSPFPHSFDIGEEDVLEDLVEKCFRNPCQLEIHVNSPCEQTLIGVPGWRVVNFDTAWSTLSPAENMSNKFSSSLLNKCNLAQVTCKNICGDICKAIFATCGKHFTYLKICVRIKLGPY